MDNLYLQYIYCNYYIVLQSFFVNDSLYASDWTSLSPKFRKQMSIAMARWAQYLKPCAAYIIPLSLTTFIGVSFYIFLIKAPKVYYYVYG